MFPLEPCFGVSLLASHFLGCEHELSALVSILSSENVWLAHSRRDNVGEEQLVDIRRRFGRNTDEKSDHMLLVNMFSEWIKNNQYKNDNNWCWKNRLQSRALKQAKNIQEQIMDHMKQVKWDKLEEKVPEFRALRKDVKREIRKELEANKKEELLSSYLVRRALCEGFFMNTCTRAPSTKEGSLSYMKVEDGFIVKLDRSLSSSVFSMFDHFPDLLIYTDISGTGSGQNGVIKMSFEASIPWLSQKFPLLKKAEALDINELCGKSAKILGKREKPEASLLKEEAKVEESREDKMKRLKERYAQRNHSK